MKLNDGHYDFDSVGSSPDKWAGDVSDGGDTLTTSDYGTFVWDEDQKCYVNHNPEPPAVISRLYIYPSGSFAIISEPPGTPIVVGFWKAA